MLSKRKQVILAVAGSVGIHLLVLFAWAFSVQWFPHAEAALSQTPEQIKMEVVQEPPADTPPPPDPPDAVSTPTPKPKLTFKDTDDLAEAKEAPKDVAFESGRNTEAASEQPATSDKPLPTQKGRPIPSFAFDSHPYTPGDETPSAGQEAPQNMPPVPQTAPPPPRAVSKPLAQATPPRAPTATPAASVADPRELAMLTPQSIPTTPVEAEPNPYDPSFRPPTGMTEPPPPTPVPRRGGYQPLQERADLTGGNAKLGANSVASAASPAGRYIAIVKRAIDTRYHQYVDARADTIVFGMVRVHFIVDREGKVRATRVEANTANEALAAVTLRAVAEAKLPPMPAEVASSFEGGVLDMSINFTLE